MLEALAQSSKVIEANAFTNMCSLFGRTVFVFQDFRLVDSQKVKSSNM
jgi:hypothetical protein